MIFTDFLKAREEKNKYDMLAQNFNRRTNVAMEHNTAIKAIHHQGGIIDHVVHDSDKNICHNN